MACASQSMTMCASSQIRRRLTIGIRSDECEDSGDVDGLSSNLDCGD